MSDLDIRKRELERQSLERLRNDIEAKKELVQVKIDNLKENIDKKGKNLIEKLDQIYQDAKSTLNERDSKLSSIETLQVHIEDIHHNELMEIAIQSVSPLIRKMEAIKDECLLAPSIKLEWNREAIESIECFYKLDENLAPYAERVYPEWLAVEKGQSKDEMEEPYSILSLNSKEILVSDRKKNVIQIYDQNGEYVSTISDPNLKRPLYMCSYKNAFFVTCGIQSGTVLKFERNQESQWEVVRIQKLGQPITALNVDENGILYVFLTKKRTVIALEACNLEVIMHFELKTEHFVEGRTRLMDAKLYNSEWYVLFAYSEYPIQCFRKNGELVRTVVGNDKLKGSSHFCMDKEGNIIASETISDQVKVFSNEGEFETNIGSNGDVSNPRGITLNCKGRIIVCDLKSCDMLSCY